MVEVLAPRAGFPGLIASLMQWGMRIIDVVSGAGAITKYTVGPAWTGAEFPTIPAAVAAVVADGHSGALAGQIAKIEIYPGVYPEAVTIPATVPRFVLSGAGYQTTEISGAFLLQLPDANGQFAMENLRFSGTFNVSQAVATSTVTGRLESVAFAATTIAAPRLDLRAWDCLYGGDKVWNLRVYIEEYGCRQFAGIWDMTSIVTAEILGTYFFGGAITFRGGSIGLTYGLIYHAGSPGITDECTAFSEYSGNTFSRNAGPAGPVIVKTGASSLTDGGNRFVDGSTYPFIQVTGGNRPNRGQTDDELRNVLHVSGSPTLTPAQVGGQRKTTVLKDDGGGTVTLPAIADVEPGCTIVLKDVSGNATANPWSVVGAIDGAGSYVISTDFAAVEVQADPVAVVWMVIGSYL